MRAVERCVRQISAMHSGLSLWWPVVLTASCAHPIDSVQCIDGLLPLPGSCAQARLDEAAGRVEQGSRAGARAYLKLNACRVCGIMPAAKEHMLCIGTQQPGHSRPQLLQGHAVILNEVQDSLLLQPGAEQHPHLSKREAKWKQQSMPAAGGNVAEPTCRCVKHWRDASRRRPPKISRSSWPWCCGRAREQTSRSEVGRQGIDALAVGTGDMRKDQAAPACPAARPPTHPPTHQMADVK